jgi:predicted RNA binding protein YcfA (HicA-like mRNA interferase family)
MKHPDGRATTIPVHSSTLPKGTLKSILRQAKISIEELKKK